MSFQAYLDAIEDKTGLTPREFIALAHGRGFDEPATKPRAIIEWLKAAYGLGRGLAMAPVHLIKHGCEDRRKARRVKRVASGRNRRTLAGR